MDKNEFTRAMNFLSGRMKHNLAEYKAILKDAEAVEQKFCCCGFISEWLEKPNRESIDELYELLISKMNKP